MTPDYPEIYFPHYRSEACLFSPHTRTVENGWVCGRHVHHTMLEILLVVEGTLTTILGCNEFSQHVGDIIIVSPMMVHDFQVRLSERVSFFTMHIHIEDTEILHLISSNNHGFYPSDHPLNQQIKSSVERMIDTLFHRGWAKMSLMREVYTILDEMQQYFSVTHDIGPLSFDAELSNQVAKAIQALVLRNSEEAVAGVTTDKDANSDWLEEISRKLGVSRRHCHRLFRQAFGIPPREYLMVLKQQEAMQMLVTSSDSIERIAHKIGYENVQSFSRQFTAWAGCTPSTFRKNNLNERHHLVPINLQEQVH
ncbi:AraC family transcriptional regulator [Paenibacillus motobuensis]|uniref:AraC family transcriptional regulator n=1 Tax=Paenibacillus TaxID=44249 RepID=UPI00203C8EA2|nr:MULTISPECIES: AraC family transcriptional regulator [Paenibacillus]MCM3038374.1 AraC family transcriptional regulator [Paenibacillus lutimineralis]MCM3645478.1 AraC family transcriptional regulator [Paenibacillus motobuensis]